MKPQYKWIVIGAFRYALDRRGGIVAEFVKFILDEWENLTEDTQFLIKAELDRCFELEQQAHKLGYSTKWMWSDEDRAEWKKVQSIYKKTGD